MTKNAMAILPGVLLLALPATSAAGPFSGIGIGAYAHSSTAEAESTTFYWDGDSETAENEDSHGGLGLKLSYRSSGDGFGYSFDARLQNFDATIQLYGDSRLDVNHFASVGTSIGYVAGPHFLYGIAEVGVAGIEYRVDGYMNSSDSLLSFGLGVGYILAVNDNVELNAEVIGRRFQDYEVTYSGGHLNGSREEIETAAGTVSLGLNYRF